MDLPSVTQILQDVGLAPDYRQVPAAVLEPARMRGQALHQAIAWHHEGVPDPDSIHPDIAPAWQAYLQFLRETGHRPIASEVTLIHPTLAYQGHADRIGWLHDRRVILDWKFRNTITLPPVERQLAAYRLAWQAMHPDEPIHGCAVVQFTRDGHWRLYEISAAQLLQAEEEFCAALVVWRARQRR